MLVTRHSAWRPLGHLWSWLFAAKVIAWLDILGGSYGLFLYRGALLAWPFFGLSIMAGVLLLVGHREGVEAALLVEGLQVIAFQVPRAGYQFASGIQLYVYFTGAGAGLSVGLRSSLRLWPQGTATMFAVNLFSLVALPILWRAMRDRDTREAAAAQSKVAAA